MMKKPRNPYQKNMWQKGHKVELDKKKQASKDACRKSRKHNMENV
jgi:hypothetical protein